MEVEGPPLEPLLHRLTDCPAEFLSVDNRETGADLVAVVCDTLRAIGAAPPEAETAMLAKVRKLPETQWPLIAVVCWLLYDEWFHHRRELVAAVWKLLTSDELTQLARLVRAHRFVEDADRREELVRVCLAALGLRPQGESATAAGDRLSQLDSVERDRVLRATAAAERRAREIREAMARKQALESASRYGE
jgi:hypothetical protein